MCDRFIGQQPDGILLDPEDSFWCQALEDLETCGQSELLREIEVSDHPPLPPASFNNVVEHRGYRDKHVSSLLCCHANISIKPYQSVCLTFSVYIIAQYIAYGTSILFVQVGRHNSDRTVVSPTAHRT